MQEWSFLPASKMARDYYDLPDSARLREVILSIRADEAIHREVNHHFADLRQDQDMEHETVHIIEKKETKIATDNT